MGFLVGCRRAEGIFLRRQNNGRFSGRGWAQGGVLIHKEKKLMMLSLVLIEGQSVSEETLRSLSLGNAKQLVIGNAHEFGVILYIAASAPVDLSNALRDFAQVTGVTRVVTLALQTTAG
jgi:hypothetical protein